MAILSLLCILVFSCGSFFIYKIYLRSYKKEFRSFVNIQKQDKLESYTIPLNQLYVSSAVLKWEDENKEVIIEGKLYDVIALVIQNDQVILSLFRISKSFNSNKSLLISSMILLRILRLSSIY